MGMNADVIAIGPFSTEVAEFLDYSAKDYEKTRPGAIVTHQLFDILEGSTMSRRLARCLGIDDPWDFNQHAIDLSKVDLAGLFEFVDGAPHYAEDLKSFQALRQAGFAFHFRPNG